MLNTMSRQVKYQVRCQDIVTTEVTNNNYNENAESKRQSYLLTQFGATSPTSGGYQARKEIHYSSINSKHT